MLTKDEFSLLTTLISHCQASQRELSSILHQSLGKINQLCQEMTEKGLIADNQITSDGMEALVPYKVKNAIIMAAGMSTRFAPLSYEKPKALLQVKGEILIEREIRQLQAAGITDITVVVGYMKEKLYYLADKFHVKIKVNEDYYRYNNTSTLILVADELDNTYVCSSDNYFVENPFTPYVYRAYYSAVYSPAETDEYCLSCNRSGRIIKVTHGGCASWYMLGHVYFDKAFSRRFSEILHAEYHLPITRDQLWEDLYIRHLDELEMYIKKYDRAVIKEFDSLDELREFDENYLTNTQSPIFRNICKVLHCQENEISHIKPIKVGLTNLSFLFECRGQKYVYRHPGIGTSKYINRQSEAASMEIAKNLQLDNTYIYMDPENGWKISYFISNAKTLDYHNPKQVSQALNMIRKLHTSGLSTPYSFDIWKQIHSFEKTLKEKGRENFEGAKQLRELVNKIHAYVENDRIPHCLCHCDCYDPNFLIAKDGSMFLIDWEYSGMADPAVDIGTFIACSDYSLEEAKNIIAEYLQQKNSSHMTRHYIAYAGILSYYWFIWSLYQDSIGKSTGKWSYIWYRHAGTFSRESEKMYEGESNEHRK